MLISRGIDLKKIYILIFLFIIANTGNVYAGSTIYDVWGYDASSDVYYQKALEFEKTYPDLIKVNILDKTLNERPVYEIILTENVQNITDQSYIDKTNISVEGGLHSRETYNTFYIFKWIEDHCLDYYDNDYSNKYDSKALLQKCIFSLVPLSNPDGFDLFKLGMKSIADQTLKSYLEKYTSESQIMSQLKANARLVDLNRNFEDIYYNKQSQRWINQKDKLTYAVTNAIPHVNYYKGEYQGSEKETQILQDYYLSRNFRVYISFHSRGQVIYYDNIYLKNKEYDNKALEYAKTANKYSGYNVITSTNESLSSYGYASNFVANNTLKPFITIETTSAKSFPIDLSHYNKTCFIH